MRDAGEGKEKRGLQLISGFLDRITKDHVGAYAAQTAYFFIMSFIPFVLFLTTFIRYTPLTYNMISDAIKGILPRNIQGAVLGIVAEVYNRSSAVLPISALIALWSAGKGIQALINGLNTIYHVKETRNWLMNRIYSVFCTLLFIVAIVGSLLLLVLGNRIQAVAARYVPFVGRMIARVISARTFLVFIALFLIFLVMYKVLPNRKATFKSQLPGALLTAVAWLLFSYFFSIYFVFFPNYGNMYGSLTAVILVMLWLYICMNLVLYGAETNAYFEKQFRRARDSMKELLLSREKEERKEPADTVDKPL